MPRRQGSVVDDCARDGDLWGRRILGSPLVPRGSVMMATVLDRSTSATERPSLGQLIRARRPGYMLPADFYLRQDVFDTDLEVLFRRQWLFVSVAADVPEPGDALTVDIGNASVI